MTAATQQIVGRERRQRVSHNKWSGDGLNKFAPPRQLRRYLPFVMKVGRVVAAYIVSPFAGGVYWVVFNWLLNGRDPQMLRDVIGIGSILGFFTLIGYVAEGLLGTPLLCWFRRRGFSSLRSFLLGGVAIGTAIWLFLELLYFGGLREMSFLFNFMFLLAGCVAPALLSTIVFWFIGGRQITNRWTRAGSRTRTPKTCPQCS